MHTPRIPCFAFAPNTSTNSERTHDVIGVNRPESYNDTLCSLRLCASCGESFQPQYRTHRFCRHACYAASLRHPVAPRFWSHVNKNGPICLALGTRCWLWTANVVGRGSKHRPTNSRHGQFTYTVDRKQRHVYAHRFSWELAYGPVLPGLQILHHCDVPPCVNTDHLFLGDHDANMKDAAAKNRLTVPRTKTFSLLERLEIYHAPDYRGISADLAEKHKVTKRTISRIRSGRFIGSGVWAGTKLDATEGE